MNWHDYYHNRIQNRVFEQAFEAKYIEFIKSIRVHAQKAKTLMEVGSGTSLVTKLLQVNKDIIITDKNPAMLALSTQNYTKKVQRYAYSILNKHNFKADLVYSHGVLEHFNPMQLKKIRDNLTLPGVTNIHYVPTIGYASKSFGDENLWNISQWLDIIHPDRYIITNEGKDLTLIWKAQEC